MSQGDFRTYKHHSWEGKQSKLGRLLNAIIMDIDFSPQIWWKLTASFTVADHINIFVNRHCHF
jgi:hypothetical protein